jgi:UDP-N-acetylmuramoyl-tripeptide--D-alanyl-D-alanine ligase
VVKLFHVPDENIKKALEQYQPTNSRSQLILHNSNKIILDAYNANPSSMKAAIENFAQMEGPKKILLLGSMMELGDSSKAEHEDIIRLVSAYHWHKVVLVGKEFTNIPDGFIHFADSSAARDWFKHENPENAQVLIKGSRSMQMEKVLE